MVKCYLSCLVQLIMVANNVIHSMRVSIEFMANNANRKMFIMKWNPSHSFEFVDFEWNKCQYIWHSSVSVVHWIIYSLDLFGKFSSFCWNCPTLPTLVRLIVHNLFDELHTLLFYDRVTIWSVKFYSNCCTSFKKKMVASILWKCIHFVCW